MITMPCVSTPTPRGYRKMSLHCGVHPGLKRCDVTFPLYVEIDETYNLACPAPSPFLLAPADGCCVT